MNSESSTLDFTALAFNLTNIKRTLMIDKSLAITHKSLIKVDPQTNANKFWQAWLMPDGNLYVEYGRVNYSARSHVYPCSSVTVAEQKLAYLLSSKLSKGYQEAIVESNNLQQLDWSYFGDNAKTFQEKLAQITSLADKIADHTSLNFDAIQGVFTSQLGIISPQTIRQAIPALQQVSLHLANPQSRQFNHAVADYLTLIPLTVGMKLDARSLLGNPEKIATQRRVLSQLEKALDLISQLRQEMLNEAVKSPKNSTELDRAWWISWGVFLVDPPTKPSQTAEDFRSTHICWTNKGC